MLDNKQLLGVKYGVNKKTGRSKDITEGDLKETGRGEEDISDPIKSHFELSDRGIQGAVLHHHF